MKFYFFIFWQVALEIFVNVTFVMLLPFVKIHICLSRATRSEPQVENNMYNITSIRYNK